MHNPSALEGRTWNQSIAANFPGAQLVVEGQAELGVVLTANAQNP
jgi:hypothetical protein